MKHLNRMLAETFGLRSTDNAKRDAARDNKNALAKAKRLAAKHGIDLDHDHQGGWWVTWVERFPDEATDPCNGNRFCSDGIEVLECVQRYLEAATTTH